MSLHTKFKLTVASALCCASFAVAHASSMKPSHGMDKEHNVVAANSCDTLSPLKHLLGEAYYDLTYVPQRENTAIDEKALNKLLSRTKFKTGTGQRHTCFGLAANDSLRVVSTDFELDSIVRSKLVNGTQRFKAFEETKRAASAATIELPVAKLWEADGQNAYKSSVFFRRINKNSAPFNSDLGVVTGSGSLALGVITQPNQGSSMGELATRIERQGDRVILSQTLYINGHKVEWVTWNLES